MRLANKAEKNNDHGNSVVFYTGCNIIISANLIL